jgi:hypothetical protein
MWLVIFYKDYPYENLSRFRIWGVCHIILQPCKKTLSDSMSGRQSSRGFTFNTKSAVQFLASWRSRYPNDMVIWYCWYRHICCSQPQLSVHHSCSNNLVYEGVSTKISLAEFHVSLKEKNCIMVCGQSFFRKLSIRKFFTIQFLGSMSYIFAAVQKNLARFDVRKSGF